MGRHPACFPNTDIRPRASRLTLEVLGVRTERVQNISHKDAVAEGSPSPRGARDWFRDQWDAANKNATWAANPWVWAIEFQRI